MNPKKQKVKDRRRARKLADQAWDAVHADNLDLAEKIIRRAVDAQPDNPVLWDDQGVILGLRHKDAEAALAFRTALSLAPTFAEPYAHLATLRVRQGFAREAVELQTQAARHAPHNTAYAEQREAYRALAGEAETSIAPAAAEPPSAAPAAVPCGPWAERLAELDWDALGQRLTR